MLSPKEPFSLYTKPFLGRTSCSNVGAAATEPPSIQMLFVCWGRAC